MKILLCNIAIRPEPDPFPPVACTSLCNVLIKAGYDPEFYDIDAKRPSREELSRYFREKHFDVVGISAVVSTGYRYTKDLAAVIKEVSPDTQIILGGNLAAAYEIILRKCQIDVCVIGEGEKVLLNLIKHLEKNRNFKPSEELYEVKGIALLDPRGASIFTGHEQLIENYEIEEPDYGFLEKFSNLNQYILDPMSRYDFSYDPRSHEKHRQGKKMATIFTSKGCINRCTFCHRWIKGYRIIPVEKVIAAMEHLMNRYNVGFFSISDECFGENKVWLEEFIRLVKPLDILFQIGGARVSIIKGDPTIIQRLKEAGLTAIYFGMESGSDKILAIMEKNATSAENLTAARICSEAGIYTVVQLVIGMPGENKQTINETIEFVKNVSDNSKGTSLLSINYLQALPGTPCYEFLRYHGFLGESIEDEEFYLMNISDINAAEFRHYINVSEEPVAEAKLWQMKITVLNQIHYLKRNGWRFSNDRRERESHRIIPHKTATGRIKLFFKGRKITYKCIDALGELFWRIVFFNNCMSVYGTKKTFSIMLGFTKGEDKSRFKMEASSLRKFLQTRV